MYLKDNQGAVTSWKRAVKRSPAMRRALKGFGSAGVTTWPRNMGDDVTGDINAYGVETGGTPPPAPPASSSSGSASSSGPTGGFWDGVGSALKGIFGTATPTMPYYPVPPSTGPDMGTVLLLGGAAIVLVMVMGKKKEA